MTVLITANDLARGHVLWWSAGGWSPDLAQAIALDPAEADAIRARAAAGERVLDLALVPAEAAGAAPRPTHIRERIRSFGPTVRPDLARPGTEWR